MSSISVIQEPADLQELPADVQSQSGILVIDDTNIVADTVKQLYKNSAPVYAVSSLVKAVEILAEEEISIILLDISIQGSDATAFIKLLKQQYPLIMAIVLTDAIDADSAVDLINQGQIFRYLSKPAFESTLKVSINQALFYYNRNKKSPELLLRHSVESTPEIKNTPLAQRLLGSIKSLRKRFSFA